MGKTSLELRDELHEKGRVARLAGLTKSDCPFLSEEFANKSGTYLKRSVRYWIAGWESVQEPILISGNGKASEDNPKNTSGPVAGK